MLNLCYNTRAKSALPRHQVERSRRPSGQDRWRLDGCCVLCCVVCVLCRVRGVCLQPLGGLNP
jgi:hypothetical protein